MYENMKEQFQAIFHKEAEFVYSAPGRSELSGNHTDHQHGCVLAAAINLEAIACVARNDDNVIRIQSKGYPLCTVDLSDLSVHADEMNTTMALIRGVAARMKELGCDVKGFDAYVESTVLPGSGLSSSAAFEVLVGTIINGVFFDNKCTAVEIAQISQYAENVYFGKPCGLMDQMACSVGNIISIDFADTTLYHHYGQPLQVAFTKFHARAGGDGHVLHIFLQRLDLHRHSANDSKLHSFSLLIPDR